MLSNASSGPRSPLRIKKDDKFYSRLLSKESSLANPSFRLYHGVTPGSVPFVWESQPGTPKTAAAAAAALPPLTPPPSSHFNPVKSNTTKKKKSSSRLSLSATLLLGLATGRSRLPSSPMSSSSVSSSSSSSHFSLFGSSISHPRSRFSSFRASLSSGRDDQDDDNEQLPRSILCFRVRRIPRLLFHRNREERTAVGHRTRIWPWYRS